jgi:acetyl-CoA carboxylase carboxyl transferase subunit alpha
MVETATNALKITANDLREYKLIDDIIDEPMIGAHREKEKAIQALKEYFLSQVEEINKLSAEERYERRYARLMSLGSFTS